MTIRAAIYARFSTDKQRESSIEEQVSECRTYAEAHSMEVIEELVVEEPATSGATRIGRPLFMWLVEEKIDEWDILLAWDTARLGREQEDVHWLKNRVAARRKRVVVVSQNRDFDDLAVQIEALADELTRKKVAVDTRRAMKHRAEQGLTTGSLPFGYQSDGKRLSIDPEQSPIVKRIFQEYVSGRGMKAIATRLNDESVPPRPRAARHLRKKSWSLATIRAMLVNEVYRGEVVWNRSEWIRDHETNKRKRHVRPESEWVRAPRPELRIIPDDVWYRAEEIRKDRGKGASPRSCGNRRNLLAGLLECGECGGAFHVIYHDRMGCGRRDAGGPSACGNTLRLDRREVEERVLSQLDELLRPDGEAIAWIRRRVLELVAVDNDDLSEHHLEIAQKRLTNLLEVVADTGSSCELTAKIREEEGRVRRLRSTVRHRPGMDSGKVLAAVGEAIADVRETLGSPDSRPALEALLGGDRLAVHATGQDAWQIPELFDGRRLARLLDEELAC